MGNKYWFVVYYDPDLKRLRNIVIDQRPFDWLLCTRQAIPPFDAVILNFWPIDRKRYEQLSAVLT